MNSKLKKTLHCHRHVNTTAIKRLSYRLMEKYQAPVREVLCNKLHITIAAERYNVDVQMLCENVKLMAAMSESSLPIYCYAMDSKRVDRLKMFENSPNARFVDTIGRYVSNMAYSCMGIPESSAKAGLPERVMGGVFNQMIGEFGCLNRSELKKEMPKMLYERYFKQDNVIICRNKTRKRRYLIDFGRNSWKVARIRAREMKRIKTYRKMSSIILRNHRKGKLKIWPYDSIVDITLKKLKRIGLSEGSQAVKAMRLILYYDFSTSDVSNLSLLTISTVSTLKLFAQTVFSCFSNIRPDGHIRQRRSLACYLQAMDDTGYPVPLSLVNLFLDALKIPERTWMEINFKSPTYKLQHIAPELLMR